VFGTEADFELYYTTNTQQVRQSTATAGLAFGYSFWSQPRLA